MKINWDNIFKRHWKLKSLTLKKSDNSEKFIIVDELTGWILIIL